MPFERELGTTVRRDHILQIIKALEGDAGYGTPIAIYDVNSAESPALLVRNQAENSVAMRIVDSTGENTLFEVSNTGLTQTFSAGSIAPGTGDITPGITLGGDSNTGIWHPGGATQSGEIGIVAAGGEIMRWASDEITANRPIVMSGLGDNDDALTIAPVQTTGDTQQGPKIVLRSTAYDGNDNHVRDFMIRATTTDTDGTGQLDFITRLDGGSETTVLSILSTGTTVTEVAVSAHATQHGPTGTDPLPADQAATTASVRTLGTGALQAAAGNHSHSGTARFALPPLSWMASSTSGATFGSVAAVGASAERYEWSFSGSATNTIYVTLPVPTLWAGGNMKVKLFWTSTGSSTGTSVYWRLAYAKYDIATSMSPSLTTFSSIQSLYTGSAESMHTTEFIDVPVSAATTPNGAPMIDIAISRIGADALDTSSVAASLRMVTVEIG